MISYKVINIKNHLYKYITIFMVVFSIGFSSLHVIKANGGSLVYTNYTVKWTYDINWTENTVAYDILYIDLTISFDDYYSGYIYLYHTSYLPSYICVGGQIDSNTSNALRVQFTDVNQIYMKFVFTTSEIREINSTATINDWMDGSIFTFTSASASISISSNLSDIVSSVDSVAELIETTNTTLSTISSNIDGVESYLSSLVNNTDGIESSLTSLVDNTDDVETSLTTLINSSNSIINGLSTVDSSINSVISALISLDDDTIASQYYQKVLISQTNEIHDISSLTTVTLATNLSQSNTVTLDTRYSYYIINPGNYSYGNFDYIVFSTNKKTNYTSEFSYLKDNKIYTLYFNIVSSVISYSLQEYDPSTNETSSISNSVVAYLYGTNDNPYALTVNTNVTVEGDFTFNGTVEVDTEEIESLLNDIIASQGEICTYTGDSVVLQNACNYLNKALLSERYVVHDISNIDSTLITSNLTQSSSVNVSGYRYLLINTGNYSYSNQDIIVIDVNNKTNYSSQFYYLKDDNVYTLSYTIADSVFSYTLQEFNLSTAEESDISNSLIAYLYGTNDNPYNENALLEEQNEQIIEKLDEIIDCINNLDITSDQQTTIENNYETIENNNTTINNNLPDLEDITLPTLDLDTISLPNIMSNIAEDLESVSENIIVPVYSNIITYTGFDWVIKIGLIGIVILGIRRLFK